MDRRFDRGLLAVEHEADNHGLALEGCRGNLSRRHVSDPVLGKAARLDVVVQRERTTVRSRLAARQPIPDRPVVLVGSDGADAAVGVKDEFSRHDGRRFREDRKRQRALPGADPRNRQADSVRAEGRYGARQLFVARRIFGNDQRRIIKNPIGARLAKHIQDIGREASVIGILAGDLDGLGVDRHDDRLAGRGFRIAEARQIGGSDLQPVHPSELGRKGRGEGRHGAESENAPERAEAGAAPAQPLWRFIGLSGCEHVSQRRFQS